jgi:hypothetical protein
MKMDMKELKGMWWPVANIGIQEGNFPFPRHESI